MDLNLPSSSASAYRSPAQRARVLTETWAAEQLYCVSCSSETLERLAAGRAVRDFRCPNCKATYQLKSKKSRFGSRVVNSAYQKKMEAIAENRVPNYLFLTYDSDRLQVRDLFGVPGHFITESTIRKRKPLASTARRAGWVGSEILLAELPPDARVSIVSEATPERPDVVRQRWALFAFLASKKPESRGWMADVLAVVRALDKNEFSLDEVYASEPELKEKHPQNSFVKPKIRQQLQNLREQGIIEFLGRGQYRLKA